MSHQLIQNEKVIGKDEDGQYYVMPWNGELTIANLDVQDGKRLQLSQNEEIIEQDEGGQHYVMPWKGNLIVVVVDKEIVEEPKCDCIVIEVVEQPQKHR